MQVEEIHILLLLLSCSFLFTGFTADALSYDYTASIECLETPHKPQYGGGIVVNPEFDHGLKGWSTFGDANIEARVSEGGNKFIVARGRNQPYDSFSQEFFLQKDMLYTFSAWIQVSDGNVPVSAVFKTTTGYKHAGAVVGESGCWSMLKGGLTVDTSGPAKLYFETNNTSIEIWVDSISLQPFTNDQWRSHQVRSIEKARKGKVRLQAVDSKGSPLPNTRIEIKQNQLNFPFGCAITKDILTNTAYQNWFTSRFRVTTFENEMKWYSTESSPGKEDYSVPDAMLQFAKQHNVAVRGHNIFWDDPQYQPGWLNSLTQTQLAAAAEKRISSVLAHYKGQVIAWDVVNENLHFSYFESKLGSTASAGFYQRAHQLDNTTPMFMNEYNTIEESGDQLSSPAKYLAKLREIQSFSGGNRGPIGIGLEAHFNAPNLPYMRASIDTLAATKLPIWLTEVDVQSSPNQASYLEQILREAHAHPVINGIVMWAAWKPQGCYRMCLTDNNFKNLPTGDVVDKLLREWGQHGVEGTTDANGFFETALFHGDYEVTVSHPAAVNSSFTQTFNVASTDILQQTMLHVQVPA